jgi:hypothetical protein
MAVQIFEVAPLPGRMAVSRIGGCIEGGTFLLDFSKSLKFVRGNKWLPFPTGISVPVIHQTQTEGGDGFGIAVYRWTPMWKQIKLSWKLAKAGRIQTQLVPTGEYNGLQVIGDFATKFPEFSQLPK